ncbi:MAG TPA: hypothetical protein VFK02_15985 [Kofleriaceae bacterium]|nr:hypothetical protein [Kofleriaceae bacterium]
MRLAAIIAAVLAGCGSDDATTGPATGGPQPPTARAPATRSRRPAPLPTNRAPSSGPAALEPSSPWRAQLAEVDRLEQLRHPAFDVPGGYQAITERHEQALAELTRRIAALPDDAPDLPEAACLLARHTPDRGMSEAQLRRGIAVAHRRAAAPAQRFGSLRAQYLALPVDWRGPDGRLTRDDVDLILGGPAHHACATPDEGHLRLLLADLYETEYHYPRDPFTGQAYPGRPTSQRGSSRAASDELEAMYGELAATSPDDLALATLIDVASVAFCQPPRPRLRVCMPRLAASARVLAIRARALPVSDPLLADARIAYARLLVRTGRGSALRDAEQALRRVLAQAELGSEPRLHAALDLRGILRARGDTDGARALEPGLREDLARPAGPDADARSTIAGLWAAAARVDGRDADAAALLDAAITGLETPGPACADSGACDHRGFIAALLDQQADHDPGAAPALRQRSMQIKRELAQERARAADEVRRLIATRP